MQQRALRGGRAPQTPASREAFPGLELDLGRLERDAWQAFIVRDEPLVLLEGEGGAGGGAGDAGGGDTKGKTFSQDELNAIIAKERKTLEAKFADYDELKEKVSKVAELEKQLETIREESELKGKSEAEKERIKLEKRMQQYEQQLASLTTERDEAKAAAERAASARLDVIKRHQVVGALQGAKVVAGALDDAVDAFLRGAEIETDDDGNIKGITVAGGHFDKPEQAAAAFLKTKPYYQPHPGGGSGNVGPNGAPAPENLQDLTFDQLADVVARQAGTPGT